VAPYQSDPDDAAPIVDASAQIALLKRQLPTAIAVNAAALDFPDLMVQQQAASDVVTIWVELARSKTLGQQALQVAMLTDRLHELAEKALHKLEVIMDQAEQPLVALFAARILRESWTRLLQVLESDDTDEVDLSSDDEW
jgi:hypothetical protein